jgi:hypothetical protein
MTWSSEGRGTWGFFIISPALFSRKPNPVSSQKPLYLSLFIYVVSKSKEVDSIVQWSHHAKVVKICKGTKSRK